MAEQGKAHLSLLRARLPPPPRQADPRHDVPGLKHSDWRAGMRLIPVQKLAKSRASSSSASTTTTTTGTTNAQSRESSETSQAASTATTVKISNDQVVPRPAYIKKRIAISDSEEEEPDKDSKLNVKKKAGRPRKSGEMKAARASRKRRVSRAEKAKLAKEADNAEGKGKDKAAQSDADYNAGAASDEIVDESE